VSPGVSNIQSSNLADLTVSKALLPYAEFSRNYYSKDGLPTKEFFAMQEALGDPVRARRDLSRMEEFIDQAFSYFTTTGDSYYFEGEYDQAATWSERAFTLPGHDKDVAARMNLALAKQQCDQGDIGAQIQCAIDLYLGTLRLQTANSPDWAMTQNNLGAAWRDKRTGDKEENIDNAIEAYTAALSVRTHDRFPADWAMTQNNLGLAWWDKPTGDKGENIDKAIEAYTAALTVYTRDRFSAEWATTQINLGNAWRNKPTRDKGENIDKAIEAYGAALTVFTRDRFSAEWATTQNNLGLAWGDKPMAGSWPPSADCCTRMATKSSCPTCPATA
jgi:tetratricopeptide (TPR) repeat protein